MKWFYDLKIGTKLISSFALVALIAAFIGYEGVSALNSAAQSDTELYENYTVPLGQMADIGLYFQRVRVNTRDIILATTPTEINQFAQRIQAHRDSINAISARFEKSIVSKEMQEMFAEFKASRVEYAADLDDLIDFAKQNKDDAAFKFLLGDMSKTSRREQDIIEKMADAKVNAAHEKSEANTVAAEAARTTMLVILAIGVLVAMGLGVFISRIISKPLQRGVEMMQEMSKGHINARLNITTKDEVGMLAQTMDEFADKLQTKVVAVMDHVASGNLSDEVDTSDKADMISPALKQIITSLRNLSAEAKRLTEAALAGKLSTRGDVSKYNGAYKDIVQGVNDTLDGVIGPLNVAAEYVDRIAKGDIPAKITDSYNGDFNEIKNNLNMAIDAVNALVADATLLAKAAVDGKLATRADASKHHGDYQKIVQGVNDTLDSVIRPLNVAAEYVDRISKGDIPNKITDSYNGDFNEIKNNLNTCIDAVNALVADASLLAKAALEGKLSTRADASKHGGDFRKIVQGVNDTLDSVINPLNVAAKYVDDISRGAIPAKITDNYSGDFNAIKNNLNTCIDAVNALVADANLLALAAVEGRLNTRADASKHQGDFRKVVQGVNDTLDSVIVPVQEGTKFLARMADGDMTVRINSDYKGDHQLLKNSINTVSENLDKALQDVTNAVSATASASSQISSSTEEMAAGSQEQSSQANEVASAVEQMTKTIIDNSRNASTAAETAKKAKEAAGQGGKVVDETILGMKRIAEVVNVSAETVKALGKSSEQIGEIIAVIDDIADQTNLLALNAAIEAARAGEQGRGFAVVADEVRKLAERTTKATKEIASMIKQIQSDTSGAVTSMNEGTTEVSKGIKLADKAGESLGEIVNISQTVTDMITQIATASEEQSSTSEQISKNVEAISTVTSQTASGTQQVARAAEDLNRLTENLQNLISKFKISTDTGGSQYRTGAKPMKEEKSRIAVKQNGRLVEHD